MTRPLRHSAAFSLVEILTVLAIVSILSVGAVVGLQAVSKSTARQRAVREVIGWCDRARAEALASGRPVTVAFAVETASQPENRFRAYAMYQRPVDGGDRALQSAWQILPTGISFRYETESLIAAPRTEFKIRDAEKWSCPYVEFDARGRITAPIDPKKLRLVIFEGSTEGKNAETLTAHSAGGGPVSGTIAFSRTTGRVRYEEGS